MGNHKACQDVERHRILHSHLDELLACFIEQHGGFSTDVKRERKGLSNTNVLELAQWSAKMAGMNVGEPSKVKGDTEH